MRTQRTDGPECFCKHCNVRESRVTLPQVARIKFAKVSHRRRSEKLNIGNIGTSATSGKLPLKNIGKKTSGAVFFQTSGTSAKNIGSHVFSDIGNIGKKHREACFFRHREHREKTSGAMFFQTSGTSGKDIGSHVFSDIGTSGKNIGTAIFAPMFHFQSRILQPRVTP